jgi:hypothetical protein
MRKGLILSIITSTMILSAGETVPSVTTSSNLGEALQNGTFTAKTRTFYFDRGFDTDGVDNATALTIGGIVKYVSDDINGFNLGFAYYGSHRIGNIFSREEGKGTSILGREGEDLAFLGEAFIQYDQGKTMLKVGRQQLSTPLMQNHDLRILPSVYEAAILRNKDIDKTMIEGGYVKRYSGFTSKDNRFNDYNSKWGDEGLAYVSFSNQSIKNLSLRGQYIKALSDKASDGSEVAVSDYKYFDAKYQLPVGSNTYIKGQYGGNAYNNADDSTLLGAKVGTSVHKMVDVALLYDKISDNSFKAVESGPMYSDWQQGYSNYEASTAMGGQVIVKPVSNLSLKFGYVDVGSDEGNVRDDFSEFNFDGKYKINDYSKIRVRYSLKDQTDSSDREDRDDFRIIYYMNF